MPISRRFINKFQISATCRIVATGMGRLLSRDDSQSVVVQVKLAATRALGELASKSKFNRTKIAEEVECMPAIVEQLRLSDMQHRLTKVIEQRCMARSHLGLVARLRDALGEPHLRVVQSVMQQVRYCPSRLFLILHLKCAIQLKLVCLSTVPCPFQHNQAKGAAIQSVALLSELQEC